MYISLRVACGIILRNNHHLPVTTFTKRHFTTTFPLLASSAFTIASLVTAPWPPPDIRSRFFSLYNHQPTSGTSTSTISPIPAFSSDFQADPYTPPKSQHLAKSTLEMAWTRRVASTSSVAHSSIRPDILKVPSLFQPGQGNFIQRRTTACSYQAHYKSNDTWLWISADFSSMCTGS